METLSYADSPGFPLLSATILAPLIGAALAGFTGNPRLARQITLGAALVTLALTAIVAIAFDSGHAGLQMVERVGWMPSLGIDYALGVDGISILFLPMTAALFLAALAVSPEAAGGSGRAQSPWVGINLLILLAATLGTLAAADSMLFFVFFEATLVPGYFLIKLCGPAADTAAAARRYMVVMLLGSLPVLAGLVLAGVSGSGTGPDFDVAGLGATRLPEGTELAVFIALLVGFGIKAPALPLHLWMAPSVAAAPSALIAWLLGIKLGTYGFVRFVLPLAPGAAADWAPVVIGIEVAAVAYAGIIALGRRDLRSLLVFSSIGHVGLMTAAAFSGSADGLGGALLMMLNAGIATAALAICIGLIERRTGTGDLRALGGLIGRAPRLTAVVFVAGLALIGVPGTSGFAGEILALKGVFDAGWGFGLVALSGVVLGAGYFLSAYQRGFLGEARPATADVTDLRGAERVFGGGVILAIVLLGLFPGLPQSMTRATVEARIAERTAVLAARSAPPVGQLAAVAPAVAPVAGGERP